MYFSKICMRQNSTKKLTNPHRPGTGFPRRCSLSMMRSDRAGAFFLMSEREQDHIFFATGGGAAFCFHLLFGTQLFLLRSGRAGRPFLPPERNERPPRGTLSMGSPSESPPYRPKGQCPFGILLTLIAAGSGIFTGCQRYHWWRKENIVFGPLHFYHH